MAQQQLILITLCAIVTGIAIAVGITMFLSNNISANRDAMMEDMTIIAETARKYYLKPAFVGGGNNSYIGYKLPARMKKTENGTYDWNVEDKSHVRFTGKSAEDPDNIITVMLGYYRDPLRSWDFGGEFDDE